MFAKQQTLLSKHLSERQTPLSNSHETASHAPPQAPIVRPITEVSAVRTPAAPVPVTQEKRLVVGPQVKLKGAEILDCDTLIVEGRVEATMDSRHLRISEGGAFDGKVSIDVAEIFGDFHGELTAREQLIIHASGRVHGTIHYGQLVIETGGILSGEIKSLENSPHPSKQNNQPIDGQHKRETIAYASTL